jgi:hypothetical protein
MMRSKLGLIGLCVAVLGVMAFSASAAQAEAGANWLILTSGGVVKTGGELHATVSGELENNAGSLLTTVLGVEMQLLCTAVTLIGVSIEGSGSVTNGGRAKFTGCSMDLNGSPAPECEAHSSGSAVGTIEINAVKGLLVSVGGENRILIEPKEGETFVNLNNGEECPFESIPIHGKLYFKDCENKLSTHLTTHLFEEDPVHSDLWVLNKTAEHKATTDGSALASLSAAHTGLKWSGDGTGEEGGGESEEEELEKEKLAELPRWLVLDKGGSALDAAKLSATVGSAIASEALTLSSTILGSEVEVKCSAITLAGVKLIEKGKFAAGGKARLTGCDVWIEEEKAFECEVHSKGSSVGTVETSALKGELVKGEETTLLKVEPESGETLAGLRLGEFCPLGEEVPVKGVLYVKDANKEATEHLVNREFEPSALTSLTALGNSAKVSGGGIAFLTGEHLNRQWSGEA